MPATNSYPDDEKRMTFTEHLAELRLRIIRSGIAVIVAFVICYAFADTLVAVVAWPLSPLSALTAPRPDTPPHATEAPSATSPQGAAVGGTQETPTQPKEESGAASAGPVASATPPANPSGTPQWKVLNPYEAFIVKFKLSGYAALVLAFPVILWQICAFVFPGLTPRERNVMKFLIFGSGLLAIAGVAVGYFGVFPIVFPWLLQWVPPGVIVELRMNETISMILMGLAAFAIAFQFPMVALALMYMGLLSPKTLQQFRRLAIVLIAVASAVLTPSPDPISMLVLMFPLLILYELSIWLGKLLVGSKDSAPSTT